MQESFGDIIRKSQVFDSKSQIATRYGVAFQQPVSDPVTLLLFRCSRLNVLQT